MEGRPVWLGTAKSEPEVLALQPSVFQHLYFSCTFLIPFPLIFAHPFASIFPRLMTSSPSSPSLSVSILFSTSILINCFLLFFFFSSSASPCSSSSLVTLVNSSLIFVAVFFLLSLRLLDFYRRRCCFSSSLAIVLSPLVVVFVVLLLFSFLLLLLLLLFLLNKANQKHV